MEMKRMLGQKEAELTRLKGEINKVKSVLEAKIHGDDKRDVLATIHKDILMAGQEARQKKQGVSGESAQTGHGVHELKRFEKDFK